MKYIKFLILIVLFFLLPTIASAKVGNQCTQNWQCDLGEECRGVTYAGFGGQIPGKCVQTTPISQTPSTTPGNQTSNQYSYCYKWRENEKADFTKKQCFAEPKLCDAAASEQGRAKASGCNAEKGTAPGLYDLTQTSACYQFPGAPTPTCFDTMQQCQQAAQQVAQQNPNNQQLQNLNCTSRAGQSTEVTPPTNPEDDDTSQCIYGNIVPKINLNACLKEAFSWTASIILWLLGRLLWLSMQLFNLVLQIGILDFHKFIENPSNGGLSAVNRIWAMGRDLANIFFIFILMYIAIATVIQASGVNTQKLVIDLIITALLINFSIILPKVVIDISNSIAMVFYQNMGPKGTNGAPDVASVLINGLKPQQFFAGEMEQAGIKLNNGPTPGGIDTNSIKVGKLNWSTIITKSLGVGILILILSYYLLTASFLFLARTIVLLILIATASIAFFSRMVPKQIANLNFWNKWFDALIKESFYAPIFLFMFYLVLLLASSPIPQLGGATNTNTTTALMTAQVPGPQPATGAVWGLDILWYLMICGLAIATMFVSRSMSKWSALAATKMGMKAATGAYQNLGGATKRFAARQTVGRVGTKLANSDALQKLQTKMPTFGGFAKAQADKMAQAGGLQKITQAKVAQNQALQGASAKLSHLSAVGNFDQQLAIYGKMDAKTRADVIKEAEKSGDAKKIALVNRLRQTDNDRLVTGRGAEQGLQAEQFGKLNSDQERMDYMLRPTVNAGDREKLLKSLSAGDRIRLLKHVEAKATVPGASADIVTLNTNLQDGAKNIKKNGGEAQQMARAEKSYERTKAVDEIASDLKSGDPAKIAAATTKAATAIPAMTGSETVEFLKDNPNFLEQHQNLVEHLKLDQLNAIAGSYDVDNKDKAAIVSYINQQVLLTGGTPAPGSKADRLKKWLDLHPM